MSIVFAGCLDRMIGGNVGDRTNRTCDQRRSETIDLNVAAVSIFSRYRRIWMLIRRNSELSGPIASYCMHCSPFQIHDDPTFRIWVALGTIGMRGAHALTIPQIVHPRHVAAPVTFLVYSASVSPTPFLSPKTSSPHRRSSGPLSIPLPGMATRPHARC